jgi:hypothetical protein
MREKSLDAMLDGFELSVRDGGEKRGTTLTLWVTPELKARYRRLQQQNRQFCHLLGKIVEAAIEKAESKAS